MNNNMILNSNQLDWDDLKYFLAIAEEGSMSAAAKKLHVSQPTLSRRLATLEERTGSELFHRSRSGQTLTNLGEQIYSHALHMRDDVFAVERLITGHDTTLSGTVTISCIETIGARWLVKRMVPFHKEYPGITIDIKIDNSTSDLLRREADIALRMYRPQQNDLIAKRTITMNYAYYASKSYIEEYGTPMRLRALQGHKVILPHDEILAHTSRTQRPRQIDADIVFRSNNFMALEAAVSQGLGFGACSCLTADANPDLVRLFDDRVIFSSEIWLVSHSELKRSARIRSMYDYLGDLLQANKAAFEGL